MNIELRPYQRECIETIKQHNSGSFIISMATGLGKTVVMSRIPYEKRMLILSHREELVHQPEKYFSCSFGVEQGKESSKGDELVVSASVQTLTRRLKQFKPDDFDVIVTDEAHHAVAGSYRKIYDYFSGRRLHLGFTATPNRADNVGLENVFDDIIFERDLLWGIKNGWLCNLECVRADIGIDLEGVATKYGDFDANQLERRINIESINQNIVAAIVEKAVPPVLVFCASVNHAHTLASMIPGAVSIAGGEPRENVLENFKAGKIPVLTNCMVFTEGTDLPNIRTVVIARPTKSQTLYAQMVGRATRKTPDKDNAMVIDCVGCDEDTFCTAPSLIGLSLDNLDAAGLHKIQGDLLTLEQKVKNASDTVKGFLRSIKTFDLFAKKMKLRTHGMRICSMADGSMLIPTAPQQILIPKPDRLGRIVGKNGRKCSLQSYIDKIYKFLRDDYKQGRSLWDKDSARSWSNNPVTKKQLNLLKELGIDPDFAETLTKGEASLTITGLKFDKDSQNSFIEIPI